MNCIEICCLYTQFKYIRILQITKCLVFQYLANTVILVLNKYLNIRAVCCQY